MSIDNLQEFFVHELEDVYYAENELLDALEEMAEQTENEEISNLFLDHREETEGHIDRLEEVFDMLDREPEKEKCEGIEGIINEHDEFMNEDPDQEIIDLYNLVAAQKTEHYEISAYGNLALIADRLGMEDAGDILHENLEEEQDTLDELASFTDDFDFGKVTGSAAAD